MVRSIAACLLLVGSVAVSGVSAAAAPARPFWTERYESRSESRTVSETRTVAVEDREDAFDRAEHRDRYPGRHRHEHDIHLDAGFFLGGLAGGAGADPAFNATGGGGGGEFVEAAAGAGAHVSAFAFASASAHVSVQGHGGGHHRPPAHGCGCRH